MGRARRAGVSVVLVLVVVAALLAGLAVRSHVRSAAADAGCGPLTAEPAVSLGGVTGRLTGLPATVDTNDRLTASMLLTAAAPTTIDFAAGAAADLVFVDDRGNVVGSGNYTHNAIGDTPHDVDEGGLTVAVAGQAFVCADLDDPAVTYPEDTERPLPAGEYRAAAVLSTSAGDLVTPLMPIRVG